MDKGLFVYDRFLERELPVSMDAESYKTYLSLVKVEENANGVEDIEAFRHRNDYSYKEGFHSLPYPCKSLICSLCP